MAHISPDRHPLAKSTPVEIDVSYLLPPAKAETATEAEVDSLYRLATHLIEADGVESDINGVPAVVTRHYVTTKAGDKTLYGRVATYTSPRRSREEKSLPFLVLDEDEDIRVQSPSAYVLRFVEYGDTKAIQADTDPLNPRLNERQDVEVARNMLAVIREEVTKTKREAELKRIAAAQEIRVQRVEKIRAGRRVAKGILAAAVVAGAVGGVAYGIEEWASSYVNDEQAFDNHRYTLPGGTVLSIGDTGKPEYSTELFNNTKLSAANIPHVTPYGDQDRGGDDYFGVSATSTPMGKTNIIRGVILSSSKPGQNCQTFNIVNMKLGTTMKIWTDFTAANGKSRADELEVSYQLNSATVCWKGQEANSQDDPRVAFELLPPAN